MTLAKTAKQIATDPEAQYQALRRSLRRRKGFGLLFVQATPAKASEILRRLRNDLPQKNIGTLVLDQPITNLYNLVAQRPDLAYLNILVIQGIEKSLDADIKPGYGGEGDYYNLDTVPPLLSHLNQQRDNFRDHFGHLCFVFVVPPFALKYLIRRAADFFDWQSAIFTFADIHAGERQIQTQIPQIEVVENIDLHLIHFFEGNAKYEAGDYEGAIACYDAALEIKPDLDEALYNKGNALSDLEQYEAAITCYDAALEIKPDSLEALYNKGLALGYLGQYEAAITTYDATLEIKPDDHDALNNKGIALRYLGQYDAAIACYDAALDIKPDKHEAFYNKGVVLGKLGQHEAAITCFDAALAIKANFQEALINKGIALRNLGQYEAAIACFDAALAIKPDYHEALDNKGIALGYLGQHEAAIACFDAALAIKPDDQKALYGKACCYGLQGDADNAIQFLQSSIVLDSKNRDLAKTDTDFDPIRTDEQFQALLEGE